MVSEYIKTLRQACADEKKLYNLLTTQATLVFSEHINKSNEQMLTRLLADNKVAVSTFAKADDMYFALRSAIMSEMKTIEHEVYAGKNFQSIPISFDYDEDEEESFNGFITNKNGHIEALSTRSVTTVLRTNDNAPLGIELVTIYPNMYSATTTKNKTLQNTVAKTIKQSKLYANASNIYKSYIDFMTESPTTKVFFDSKETLDQEPHITLEYSRGNKLYQMNVEANNFSIKAVNHKRNTVYDQVNNIVSPIGDTSSLQIKNDKIKTFLRENPDIKHDLNVINTYLLSHQEAKPRKTLKLPEIEETCKKDTYTYE